MARVHKFDFSPARAMDRVSRIFDDAVEMGALLQTAGRYEGRRVELDGKMLYNFGSCSYMALEKHHNLRFAAASAAYVYGTQFSFSRAYLDCALYEELEANLALMTDRPVLVTPSTTLAHLAALPVLIRNEDVVIIDQFAHASLHQATELLRDTPVRLVRHSRMDLLEQLIGELISKHERVWLIMDGLYSMLGDFAPFAELKKLLDRYPQLHLYIDDAHSVSWTGKHGRGAALAHFGAHDRVIVALSLNKAFSCAGGALALPNDELKSRIRRCGGPMLFSGPIQPPMLGAAVASSRLHLSTEHEERQNQVVRRIDYLLEVAEAVELPLMTRERTPIFLMECDSVRQSFDTAYQLRERGFYACSTVFPAVPLNRPGVRFTIGLHNEFEDIENFVFAAKLVLTNTAMTRGEGIVECNESDHFALSTNGKDS